MSQKLLYGCKAADILEMFLLNDANFLEQLHNLQRRLFVYRCVKLSSFCIKELHDKALQHRSQQGNGNSAGPWTKKLAGKRGKKNLFFLMGLAVLQK